MKQAVLELAPATQQGPIKLAEALYQIQSENVRGTESLEELKAAAKGAAMGNASLGETTSALASSMVAFHLHGRDAAGTMGQLDATVGVGKMRMEELAESFSTGILPVIKMSGVSLHDYTSALATMTDMNVPAQRAATYLRQALYYLSNESTKPAKESLEKLGITSKQLGIPFVALPI